MSVDSSWRKELNPELELVLCCLQSDLDKATSTRIQEIIHDQVSWSNVLATAFEHHVEPLVYENLKTVENVPDPWLDTLRESVRKTGGMAVLYFSELLRINEIFETNRIPLIPFKGPVLGWIAYESLTARRFLDLDFFTPQENISRAATILRAAGFEGRSENPESANAQAGYVPGEYSFFRDETRTQVELHTERTLRYFPIPLNFEKMSRRLIGLDVGGYKLQTFSVEDTLVMLCVHGAKHFWERLGWLLDVSKLIANQTVDWPLTLRIAAKLKSTRLLLLGLDLSNRLLNAPVPKSILKQARKEQNVQWLAAKVCKDLAGGASPHTGILPRAAFRFRSRDGVADGIRHTLRLATTATEHDRLPKTFAKLSGLLRPWKLVQTYGVGLRPAPRPKLAGFRPLRPEILEYMLKFAEVTADDVLYDLGCGDGGIVLAAAEKFGVRAVGVDIDPRRIADAKRNARKRGVQNHVRFVLADAKETNLSEATIVTMYLGTCGVLRLADTLKRQLRPGSRIVSCDFPIRGWPADKSEEHEFAPGELTSFYLWRMPDLPKNDGVARMV